MVIKDTQPMQSLAERLGHRPVAKDSGYSVEKQ